MKFLIVLLVIFSSIYSYALNNPFDSAHSIAMDGVIEQGVIFTDSNSEYHIKDRIHEQLKYTIGQLNGFAGVADLNRVDLKIKEIVEESPDHYRVEYRAKLFIAWPRDRQQYRSLNLYLPRSTEWTFLNEFFQSYGQYPCLDHSAHDVTVGIFWYYYRPDNWGCQVNLSNQIVSLPLEMQVSPENTNNKYPEYGKVWEDGQLLVTAIFGKAESGSTSQWDAGVQAYVSMYNQLISDFGEPTISNLQEDSVVGLETPQIELDFQSFLGPIKIRLFLLDHIQYPGNDFVERYNELTKKSDFISYAGHSGLGANIRALARMGTFEAKQYQLFLINGCDTFAYVDNSLRDAHARVNPEASSPYKYFDVITNAMPAYFYSNSRSVMAVIKALVGNEKTYRQILSEFDPVQKAVVVGEQDNSWPAPF